jgi:hypothetical protein
MERLLLLLLLLLVLLLLLLVVVTKGALCLTLFAGTKAPTLKVAADTHSVWSILTKDFIVAFFLERRFLFTLNS